MSYLNKIFSVRFTKIVLLIACFVLLIAAIWFLGPFLGFGEARPLESMSSRAIFICLALLCLMGLWFSVPFFVMAMTTTCVIVWVIGPFLLIGEHYPLVNLMARAVVIGIILLLTLLYGGWKLLLALKSNPKLLDSFFSNQQKKPDVDVSEATSVIRNAALYIKRIRKNVSWVTLFFRPTQSLNDLPWYMIIGSESAGKTSMILSSGQDFPLPEQLHRVCKESPPTKNCDCWFANDALFIDTAGKYVDQAQENLIEWDGILKAIKKYRPVKAVNGIIVTLSSSDIMGRSKTELYSLSAKIRARLDGARNVLGVRFPVYVVITKLDQLHGFSEYFRILTEQEREQIWGVTFPYDEEMKATVSDLRGRVETEFSLLEKRIERNMSVRHQEEYDAADRKKMYAMPQDFRVLTQGLTEVLQNIFFASRYDETQSYTTLRGAYFTSSNQPENVTLVNNYTLMQKWRNFVDNKNPSSLAQVTFSQKDADFLVKDVSYGRQYFLKELFSEIIIKDADLVRHNLKVESKYRFQNFLGHCLCIIVAAFLLHGFYHSYHNNGAYLDVVDAKVERMEGEIRQFLKTSNEKMLPTLLNMAQFLPEFGGLNVFNPDVEFRYGLYVGHDLVENSDNLYQFLLRRLLFPMIERQAIDALQKAVFDGNSADIYDKLKLYLIISSQGNFDQGYVVNSINKQWDNSGKIQPYGERSIFIAHLNNLFGKPEWRLYGQPLDKDLVAQARAILGRNPLNARLYERIKDIMRADVPENLTLAKMTDEQAGQIFTATDPDLAESGIPGLFTYNGYHQVFKKKLGGLLKAIHSEDSWVMGNPEKSILASIKTMKLEKGIDFVDPIKDALTRMYMNEYSLKWKYFLQNIRLRSDGMDNSTSDTGLSFDIYIMRTLVSANSPLVNLAKRAVTETTLSEQQESFVSDNSSMSNQVLDAASKMNMVLAAREKKMLWEGVDRHFTPLREFVRGNGIPDDKTEMNMASVGTQLNKVMGVLNDQYTLLVISDNAIRNGNMPALSDAGQRLSVESHLWPAPFKFIIPPLLNGAYKRVNHEIVSNSNKTISVSLGEICQNTLEGRYPFADSDEEVDVRDFERFFAPGGLADEYFRKNLADKVDTSSKPWRYKGDVNNKDSDILELFDLAQDIRNAFFPAGEGKRMALNFSVSVPYMDPTITQLNLSFDGASMSYTHGPVTPTFFKWPGARSGSVVNMTTKPSLSSTDSDITLTGPWSLLRWLDKVKQIEMSNSGKPVFIFASGKRRVDIEVSGLTYNDELSTDLLKAFSCPNDY